MDNKAMCKGCGSFTNAPDGEWHCTRDRCKVHDLYLHGEQKLNKFEIPCPCGKHLLTFEYSPDGLIAKASWSKND